MASTNGNAAAANAAPAIDLNGAGEGTSTSVDYAEGMTELLLAPEAIVSDPDSRDFLGGSLTVAIASGAGQSDRLRIVSGNFSIEDGTLYYNGAAIGSVSGGNEGNPLFIAFDRDDFVDPVSQQLLSRRVTPEIAQELIRSISFDSVSQATVEGTRTVRFTLDDGDGGTSAPATSEVAVTAADDPPVAEDDSFGASESLPLEGDLFADNGAGRDFDPDGTPIAVTAVNGDPDAVGKEILLESGARLTVFANGRFIYDPRGAFDLAASGSGAANSSAQDGFSYTITGGDTAEVSILVDGAAAPNDSYFGDSSDNEIVGTPDRDIFRLEQGGNDRAFGMDGNDSFYFGGAYTSSDFVDGGAGFDVLILQGNYGGGSGFGTIRGIESISLFSGSIASYGDDAGNFYSYNLTLNDSNVAAGTTLRFNGARLRPGEDMRIDGSAETNGSFLMFAGQGVDTLIGGAQNDVFVFAQDGRFGGGDRVDGGGGFDVVYLRGDYSIDFTGAAAVRPLEIAWVGGLERIGRIESEASFEAAQFVSSTPTALANIESIGLLSFADETFASGGDGEFDYAIILSDEIAPDGGRLTINGSRLGAEETMVVDGSAETSASLRLFGGAAADTLTGGGGADLIFGGLGADSLTGGGGADVFRYQSAQDSTVDAPDTIAGFESGVDKVDLGRIDTDPSAAGDQAFTFIGDGAFSGRAGELRLTYNQEMERWEAEGDLDGDAAADFLILFTGTEIVTASDFML